jgi:hypothetical protein
MQKPQLRVFPSQDSLHSDFAGSGSHPDSGSANADVQAGQFSLKKGGSRIGQGSKKPSSERVQHELDQVSGTLEPRSVVVRLATIVPLLLDAVEHNRGWLGDFSDDTVRLDADLFEVLLAYQELREEAAA